QPFRDDMDAYLVRKEHRAAGLGRPAVSIEPDQIDVARPLRDPFLENSCALIDHRINQALMNFGVADLAAGDAELATGIHDQHLHIGIRNWRPGSRIVPVVSSSSLLTEPPRFAP